MNSKSAAHQKKSNSSGSWGSDNLEIASPGVGDVLFAVRELQKQCEKDNDAVCEKLLNLEQSMFNLQRTQDTCQRSVEEIDKAFLQVNVASNATLVHVQAVRPAVEKSTSDSK